VHYVDARSPAVLTIHGDRDTIVPYDQSLQLHEEFRKNSARHQLFTINGGTHGGFTDAQYQESFAVIFKFLSERGVN
jgi:dipeptidyl aminopeptidase/acylaminoacyl peptidase